MSYDLYMFDPEPGVDPMDTLERLEEENEEAEPDSALLDRNRRLAAALKTSSPAYAETQLNYGVLAEQDAISVDEARSRHRDLQLMAEGGLEVNLSDHQASISFPYWDSLDADSLADAIDDAARVISSETGWRLYDPQIEQFLDAGVDREAFRSTFDVGRDHLRELVAEQDAAPPRKRFWRRRPDRG